MFHSFFFYRESCCCFFRSRDSSFPVAFRSAGSQKGRSARALLLLCLLHRVSNMKWPNAWYVLRYVFFSTSSFGYVVLCTDNYEAYFEWNFPMISGVSETSPLHQYNLDVGEDDVFMVRLLRQLYSYWVNEIHACIGNFSNWIFRWTKPTRKKCFICESFVFP